MWFPVLLLIACLTLYADKPVPHTKAPRIVKRVEPQYTEEARAARIEGTVLVRGVVDENGRVQKITVVRKLGHGLDEKAVECVGQWQFEPAMRNGEPTPVQVNVEINFRLLSQ